MVELPSGVVGPPSGQNRFFVIIDQPKIDDTFQMAEDRRRFCEKCMHRWTQFVTIASRITALSPRFPFFLPKPHFKNSGQTSNVERRQNCRKLACITRLLTLMLAIATNVAQFHTQARHNRLSDSAKSRPFVRLHSRTKFRTQSPFRRTHSTDLHVARSFEYNRNKSTSQTPLQLREDQFGFINLTNNMLKAVRFISTVALRRSSEEYIRRCTLQTTSLYAAEFILYAPLRTLFSSMPLDH